MKAGRRVRSALKRIFIEETPYLRVIEACLCVEQPALRVVLIPSKPKGIRSIPKHLVPDVPPSVVLGVSVERPVRVGNLEGRSKDIDEVFPVSRSRTV